MRAFYNKNADILVGFCIYKLFSIKQRTLIRLQLYIYTIIMAHICKCDFQWNAFDAVLSVLQMIE